jgi:hypothetical protein
VKKKMPLRDINMGEAIIDIKGFLTLQQEDRSHRPIPLKPWKR